MPTLSDHPSSDFAKLFYIGDSSTGKTGSLTSLVKAGYRIRILDMDNGIDPLKQFVMKECPDKAANVDYETRRDKFAMGDGGAKVTSPKAFVESLKLLSKWSDGSIPAEWGPKTIFVLDSLTHFSRAAYAWADMMNPGVKDKRQVFYQAQQAVENTIAMLTSAEFKTNVIVISHVQYDKADENSPTKGYMSAIGSALGPKLPSYVNTIILAESSGSGTNVRRRIKTMPTGVIDLKNPAPFKIEKELPLETGLATLFEQLKSK